MFKLLTIREEQTVLRNKDDENQDKNAFIDGLYALLCGMNAESSHNVLSSSMTHLITTLNGTQFL